MNSLWQVIRQQKMRRLESGDGIYQVTLISPTNAHHFIQQKICLKAYSSYEGKPHPPGSEE